MMKNETYQSLRTQLYEFLSIAVCFVVVGAGIGVVQGLIAFRRSFPQEGKEVLAGMGSIAAIFGATVALFVGMCLYLWLGHRRTMMTLPRVVFVSFVVGVSSAYVLGLTQNFGWLSAFITPVATIIEAIRSNRDTSSTLK